MPSNPSEFRPTEITIIVVLIAVMVLLPPVLGLWSANDNAWYTPYLIWLGVIGLGYWLQKILQKHAI
ncbi:MAG: hypothetical protein OEY09_17290 [Gammaproteobacteria bacterium]|nr:hypothetical protein [Gammaproteobacteria bacterium]